MTIATKNGVPIVKDGVIASNCGCCVESTNPCNVSVGKVSITFNNLPANCANRPGNFNGSFMIRDLPAFNECAIPLFKTTAVNSCVFNGGFPARENSRNGCNIGLSVVYRPLLEEIVIGGINGVVLKPEAGKSFRSLPYSGGVVMQSNTFATCTTQQWNAVTVTIATEPSLLAITACPANTLCTVGVDTLPSPPVGYAYHDDMTCPPCSNERIVLSDIRNQNLFYNGYGGVAEIPDATIEVEFDSGSEYYYSGLGTQTLALKYSGQVTNDVLVPGPISNPEINNLGCGWAGIFYFPPVEQWTDGAGINGGFQSYGGPGYLYPQSINFGTPVGPYFAATAILATITPVGWHMPLDRSTAPLPTLGYAPCDDSRIAYVVKLISYHDWDPLARFQGAAIFPFRYKAFSFWRGSSQTYYAAIPCTSRQCHEGVPQHEHAETIAYTRLRVISLFNPEPTISQHTITARVL